MGILQAGLIQKVAGFNFVLRFCVCLFVCCFDCSEICFIRVPSTYLLRQLLGENLFALTQHLWPCKTNLVNIYLT